MVALWGQYGTVDLVWQDLFCNKMLQRPLQIDTKKAPRGIAPGALRDYPLSLIIHLLTDLIRGYVNPADSDRGSRK